MSGIALIDYGAGNLTSVKKGLAAAGGVLFSPSSPADLDRASGIVVPGVGHFAATSSLGVPWKRAIRRRIDDGVPVLGICLGMQWLFEGSDEAPELPGLGVIGGRCHRLQAERPLKIPHVGWNTLDCHQPSTILAGVSDEPHVYFTHGFAAPVTDECVATCTHGETFAAVVERGCVFGVQFHPEKSSAAGLRLLRNFVELANE